MFNSYVKLPEGKLEQHLHPLITEPKIDVAMADKYGAELLWVHWYSVRLIPEVVE